MTIEGLFALCQPILFVFVGFAAALLGSLLGLGGGWLIVPALNVFGLGAAASVGTSLLIMVFTSAISAFQYWRAEVLQLRLGTVFGVCALLGVQGGKAVMSRLDEAGHADLFLRVSYITILLLMGAVMLRQGFKKPGQSQRQNHLPASGPIFKVPGFSLPWYQIVFGGTLAGFASGLLGIGGGLLLVPMLSSLFGLPPMMAVATSMMSIFFASSYGSAMYVASGHVDLGIAAMMAPGALVGGLVGVRLAPRIDERQLSVLFAGLTLLVACSVLLVILGLSIAANTLLASGAVVGVIVCFAMARAFRA